MAELGWAGTMKRLALPKGISDLNDLYRDNHGRFVDRLHEAMEAAESVEGGEPGQVGRRLGRDAAIAGSLARECSTSATTPEIRP